MSEATVQVDFSAVNTTEMVAAVRKSLLSGHKPRRQLPFTAERAVSHRAGADAAGQPRVYAAVLAVLILAGIAGVWTANTAFLPEMYDDRAMTPVADAFSSGGNYVVFDLNLNIRKLRDNHLARMTVTPDTVILGASHWQEAHSGLMKRKRMYNAHVHRDYWEDMLGMSEMLVRHKRLPKQLMISIRDNLFTPVGARGDFLWEPGIPYYHAMAGRLGIETESLWKTLPYQRFTERFSISLLLTNVARWYNAAERPHPTSEAGSQTLDTLLADGSILWSAEHNRFFTPERAKREALDFAKRRRNDPPKIDPRGVEAFDRLLTFLQSKGVDVVLANPPFNPVFYEEVRDSKYIAGLARVEQLTRDLAHAHGLRVIGGFDPAKVGCDAGMFIDAEHSNPACLAKILAQLDALDPPLRLRTIGEPGA